jgi:glucose/arabinose dehydrogenase
MTARYRSSAIRRALAVLVASSVLLILPPTGSGASVAATGATLVIDCKGEQACWPAAFAFTPNGKELFYLERFSGEIHRFLFRGKRDRVWATIPDVVGAGEQGALGIALDPRWHRRRGKQWVYAFITHGPSDENRIIRMRKRKKGRGVLTRRLLSIDLDLPNTNHNGGVIHFGPDRKLYAVTGDQGQEPARSQDLADPAGKVLRLNRDGSRPADNPVPGSLAFSFGHRNSFGFAFDPLTGDIWQSENGPNCNDEVNLILPGGNYAWGPEGTACPSGGGDVTDTNASGPDPRRLPEVNYASVIVPTGAAFCRGCGLGPGVEGDLLVGTFGGSIHRYDLDPQRDDVAADSIMYEHPGGVLAMDRRKNGQLFFSDTTGIFRLRA